jgi:hypothetical protein
MRIAFQRSSHADLSAVLTVYQFLIKYIVVIADRRKQEGLFMGDRVL